MGVAESVLFALGCVVIAFFVAFLLFLMASLTLDLLASGDMQRNYRKVKRLFLK